MKMLIDELRAEVGGNPGIDLDYIVDCAAYLFRQRRGVLVSGNRRVGCEAAMVRKVIWNAAAGMLAMSRTEIGKYFRRDHSTVTKGVLWVDECCPESGRKFRQAVREMKERGWEYDPVKGGER
jgi:chromosomal replication initiation ATPase DnaA